MANNQQPSVVEVSIGDNDVHIEGSESFVSEQLDTVLDEINFNQLQKSNAQKSQESKERESESDIDTAEEAEDHSKLAQVARSLDVEPGELRKYFFIDGDSLHLENPLGIPAKFALLGYLTIENKRTNKQVFNNSKMKDKLVSQEGIDLGDRSWGDLISNARKRGDIRDDPDTDQNRNKPFRLTRDGRNRFIEWVNEDN